MSSNPKPGESESCGKLTQSKSDSGSGAEAKAGRSKVRGWAVGVLIRIVLALVMETLLKGRGGAWRRLVPPLLGTVFYIVYGVAAMTALGKFDSGRMGVWAHITGPAGWLIVAGLCVLLVKTSQSQWGRTASYEVAARLLFGLPIVVVWLVVLVCMILVALPAIFMVVFSAVGSLSIAFGRKPSQVGYPFLAALMLAVMGLTAQYYNRPNWLQTAGPAAACIVAYGAVTWLFIWTRKPLEIVERLVRKYAEGFKKTYCVSTSSEASNGGGEDRSTKNMKKVENDLANHEKALAALSSGVTRLTKHRLVFQSFLVAFVVVSALCISAYALSYWLFQAPGGGIALADPNDIRSDLVHAVSLSLRSLIGDDYAGLHIQSNYATVVAMSELVLGVYLLVVVILSFSLATSSHMERVESAALQVVDEVKGEIKNIRNRLVNGEDPRTPRDGDRDAGVNDSDR